ncbi:TrbI/VirB10 family protein [Sphingobium sp. MK2]|uniref:TrbI/VirB10 family protein n=1 Tax=Sphingobium sp. MK2 TaxID=3116540 RepID=UPI0032E36382
MLTINGQRADSASSHPQSDFTSGRPTPVPPILNNGLRDLLRQGGSSNADAAAAGNPQGRFNGSMTTGSAAFARPLRPGAGYNSSAMPSQKGDYVSTEGASFPGGFAQEPMPGAPGTGSTGSFNRSGSALIYDASTSGAAGMGDDKMAGDAAPARASIIRNRPSVVAQGEILSATLETPVNSDRPGLIRAIVSRDVRSFDGSRILIPRGSRLVGEFRAEQPGGRRRILATWGRLIRPDGVAIRLDSPAADATGGIGIPGKVDSHFLARFANAALQSALQIGVNLANRRGNGSIIVSNSAQLPGIGSQNLIPNADAPPTVKVAAGAAITVFVARDLDFSGVPQVR